MQDLTMQLRDTARSLLRDGKVGLVIGYEHGSVLLRTKPCFVRNADDTDRLVWSPLCENNIASYLLSIKGRTAVFVKGCDARALLCAISEGQIRREDVTIVAMPCEGVLDRRKLAERLQGRQISGGTVQDGKVTVVGQGFSESYPLSELLPVGCVHCTHRTAPVFDIRIGDAAPEIEAIDDYADVKAFEALSPDEKRAYFRQELASCIRCFACRQACPLCYCVECFVDQTQPTWYHKTGDLSDTLLYHVVRALHLAGRCVGCGACSRACPMGIDLTVLNRRLLRDVQELYNYVSGLDPEAAPLLSAASPDDPQEFIK